MQHDSGCCAYYDRDVKHLNMHNSKHQNKWNYTFLEGKTMQKSPFNQSLLSATGVLHLVCKFSETDALGLPYVF